MGRIHDRLATAHLVPKSAEERQLIRCRQRIAESARQCDAHNAALRARPLYWPPWAFDILALAASMHDKPWRLAWRECRRLLPKSRQQYLSQHHLPKRAAFKCWLAGEVIVPDRWQVRI